jgi:hypothetical protein
LSRLYTVRAASPYYTVLLAACLLASIFILGQWQRNLLSLISELLSPTIAIIAVVSAVMAVAAIGVRGSRLAVVWFSLMLGVVLWFLSEVAWALYPLILRMSTPFPSIADAFGLIGYVPILSGTFWRPFLFLVLGLVLALSAHMLSAWATSNGSYYPGHPLELLFDWGYLSAALGFYLMRKKMKEGSL